MRLVVLIVCGIGLLFALPFASEGDRVFQRRDAFRRFARELEPTAHALRGVTGRIFDGGNAPDSIIRECLGHDVHLARIRDAADSRFIEPVGRPSLKTLTGMMLSRTERLHCTDEALRGGTLACVEWCVDAWTELAQAVEQLRRDARAYGITMEALR